MNLSNEREGEQSRLNVIHGRLLPSPCRPLNDVNEANFRANNDFAAFDRARFIHSQTSLSTPHFSLSLDGFIKKFKHHLKHASNWPFRTVYISLFLSADGSSGDEFVFVRDIDERRHLETLACTLIVNAPSARQYSLRERWFCMQNISFVVHVSVVWWLRVGEKEENIIRM